MKNLAISLSIALLACSISYAASDGPRHFYGEWEGGESGIVTIISADAVKHIWGTIETVVYIQKWESVKNLNRATNASYPNGYKLRTKNKDGKAINIFLWKHSNNNDRIRLQTEAGFLEKGGGEGDIINRVKKSVPLKQSDYYGEWNPTNGAYVDEALIYTISSKAIEYSGIGNSGEPIGFYAPILRWESVKNPDKASSYDFPDGYMISTESTGGVPIIFVLWRHSKNKDMILFQTSEDGLLLVRSKRVTSGLQNGAKNDAKAYYKRGVEYFDEEDYDRAISEFTQAIRLEPKNAEAYYFGGVAYSGKGDYNRAIADYESALRIDPNNQNARKALENEIKKGGNGR